MEEILASIRRIISEDDLERSEPINEDGDFPPASQVEPELNEDTEDEAPAPIPPEPDPEPEVTPEPVSEPVVQEDVLDLTDRVDLAENIEPALVSDPTAAAAAAAFGQLSATLLMPHDLRTLEDVVRE
ncbi:MAG: DUF2497 domain-containing protein, partial [Phenylobacterium sp.]|nr:DUF2497 domain-containing protein [Phenylobacterium sp.]